MEFLIFAVCLAYFAPGAVVHWFMWISIISLVLVRIFGTTEKEPKKKEREPFSNV